MKKQADSKLQPGSQLKRSGKNSSQEGNNSLKGNSSNFQFHFKPEDIKDNLSCFLFFSNDIDNSMKEKLSTALSGMDVLGPFDEGFLQSFDSLCEYCRENDNMVGVIGIISYKYYKANGEKLYDHMMAKTSEIIDDLENSLKEEKDQQARLLSNQAQMVKMLVVYDENKDEIEKKNHGCCEFVEKSFFQSQDIDFFKKKIEVAYNYQLLSQQCLENGLVNSEIFNIGKHLGSEKDVTTILQNILIQSMVLTRADSGSLAIVGLDKNLKRTDKDILTYFVTHNKSQKVDFSKFSLKISKKSLSGYAALTKEILNVKDVYKLTPELPYTFDNSFDKKINFRTKSMLVIPMINQKNGDVVGVVQLINKKKSFETIIDYENFKTDDIKEFDKEDLIKIRTISPFISVILQNAVLYNEIDQLFAGFVSASVSAVEQRDPATSGHSFRVASYTKELAKSCLQAGDDFAAYHFSNEQLKELEYAALLHDFGKIGVREHILVKPKKIQPENMKNIVKRIELLDLQTKLVHEKKKTNFLIKNFHLSQEQKIEWLKKEEHLLAEELRRIKSYYNCIIAANEPTVREETSNLSMEEIRDIWITTDIHHEKLISDDEYKLLKIKKGTLSEEERREIESHAKHTYEFLKRIPWTNELGSVPEIALSHHEKLDGTGYPFGISSTTIPPQTKIMTICDIYDALVASDRPYKSAVKKDVAFSILTEEAEMGKIDKGLVDLFIHKKVYQITEKDNHKATV